VPGGLPAAYQKITLINAESEEELREKASLPGMPLEYLRFVKDEDGKWTPAGGTFEGWPEHLCELKTLDPCCGSGHFLVSALLMLAPMRMEQEGLSAQDAVDAVLRENLHGLEIDQRCVEIAAFNLALAAWRYPGAGGYRTLPKLNVACSGLSISAKKEEWKSLALDKHNLRIALDWLHEEFKDAPLLGSLINPAHSDAAKLVDLNELEPMLEAALAREQTDERYELGVVAHGLVKAARLLSGKYYLVITNVPYLKRGNQTSELRDFCEKHHAIAKNDLATVFLDRCLELCVDRGIISSVLPQNWLFLTTYRKLREKLLHNDTLHLIARLGSGAFEAVSGEVVKAILIIVERGNFAGQQENLLPRVGTGNLIHGLDVSEHRTAAEKAFRLLIAEIKTVEQAQQLGNPDARIAFENYDHEFLLAAKADYGKGSTTGDGPRFLLNYWEFRRVAPEHVYWLNSPSGASPWSGRGQVCKVQLDNPELKSQLGCRLHGQNVFSRDGAAVNKMSRLEAFLYSGEAFDDNICPICPRDKDLIPAIWAYVKSNDFHDSIRAVDQALKVTAATLTKVPFDLEHWQKVADEKYPNGLPRPYSDDPTQWIFHGHPCGSVIWEDEKKCTAHGDLRIDDTVLQVAVARLLGYRWPAELDPEMELSDEAREWVKRCESLLPHADDDGIVCIPPVRGEASAADRLLDILAAAYGDQWAAGKLDQLLKQADHVGKSIETWLREKFFTQHCKLFHNRPFIWHIWDGLRDGFSVIVNYHKLDNKKLETLIYTYLGDWMNRQKADIASGVDGAEERLAAAENLRKLLELILKGEAPYDIFVRWKPIEEQPIGWNPDLNDGVRLNIRPFMSVPDVGKKGAGVLRDKPKINWNKDRGKDVESAPCYQLFMGERINDHHMTLEEKSDAKAKKKAG
jgi:hypothetical protein